MVDQKFVFKIIMYILQTRPIGKEITRFINQVVNGNWPLSRVS